MQVLSVSLITMNYTRVNAGDVCIYDDNELQHASRQQLSDGNASVVCVPDGNELQQPSMQVLSISMVTTNYN